MKTTLDRPLYQSDRSMIIMNLLFNDFVMAETKPTFTRRTLSKQP